MTQNRTKFSIGLRIFSWKHFVPLHSFYPHYNQIEGEDWADGRKDDWKELKANRWAWWKLMVFAITLLFKEDTSICVSKRFISLFFSPLHTDFVQALFIILYWSPVRSRNPVLLLENLIKPVFAYWSLQIKSFDLSNRQVVHLHHCTLLDLLSEIHHTWHLWLSLPSSDVPDCFCQSIQFVIIDFFQYWWLLFFLHNMVYNAYQIKNNTNGCLYYLKKILLILHILDVFYSSSSPAY